MNGCETPPPGRDALSKHDRLRFGLEDITPAAGITTRDELWNALADAIARGHRGALAYALAQYCIPNSVAEIERVIDQYVALLVPRATEL